MRLFGRKRRDAEVEERCLHCGEPVPQGAAECMMCGMDLRPFGAASDAEAPKASETASQAR
jgi:zinc ribbon protein